MPAIGLAATGELSYNGYTFDGASKITCNVEFVFDEAGVTVVSHRHIIDVEAIIANDGTNNGDLDRDLENIRKRLGHPGKTLKFINKGFGRDLIVNGNGNVRDLNLGPSPRFLRWAPLGDDKAAQIQWQVVTEVPVCEESTISRFIGVKELNYSVTFDINSRGDTTRTIDGYLMVVQQRDAHAVTADLFRHKFAALPLHGFKRQQSWTVNQAKNRLDFNITDTQIPTQNPYPSGVVDIQAEHSVNWSRGRNGMRYENSIAATVELAQAIPSSQAWRVFLRIVDERTKLIRRKGRTFLFNRLEISEDLFGRAHSFRVGFSFLSCIRDFIGESGLWTPLGNNWNTWVQSMITTDVFNQRGTAGLRDQVDVVVNLCGPVDGVTYNNTQQRKALSELISPSDIVNANPPEEESFLQYDLSLTSTSERPVSRQAVIQSPESASELDAGGFNFDAAGQPVPGRGAEYGDISGRTDDVLQEGGQRSTDLVLRLEATRAGHPIPRPVVKDVAGARFVEAFAVGVQWIAGNWFGVPVFKAKYATGYKGSKTPSKIKPPDNKLECVENGKAKVPKGPPTGGAAAA